jgi:membrane protease YdiL (CAAX protease family)
MIGKKNIAKTGIDIMSFAILILAFIALTYLQNKYLGSTEYPTLSENCTTFIVLGVVGLVGTLITKVIASLDTNFKLFENKLQTTDKIDFLYAMIAYLFIQVVVKVISNIAFFQVISQFDVYIFYISAAIIEEWLYRSFIINFIMMISSLWRKGRKYQNVFEIISIIVSAFVFMLVHTRYYGQIDLLIITFLGGCSQAFFYLKSQNLSVPIISHAFINILASTQS